MANEQHKEFADMDKAAKLDYNCALVEEYNRAMDKLYAEPWYLVPLKYTGILQLINFFTGKTCYRWDIIDKYDKWFVDNYIE